MNLDTILSNYLNGEPLHDAVIIGVMVGILIIFWKTMFGAAVSIFKK